MAWGSTSRMGLIQQCDQCRHVQACRAACRERQAVRCEGLGKLDDLILPCLASHERITARDVAERCGLEIKQVSRYLNRAARNGRAILIGNSRLSNEKWGIVMNVYEWVG